MGNLRAVLSVALLSVAACGDDGGSAKPDAPLIHLDAAVDAIPDSPPLPDAQTFDYSCLNNTAPANANANVTISGTAQEVVLNGTTPGIQANVGVSIKACKGDCMNGNNLGTTTSATSGAFTTAALATGGNALDGYLDATKTGDRRTLVYPPSPLTMDQGNIPLLQFSTGAFAGLNAFFGLNQNDVTNGVVGIVVTDCVNTPITTPVTLTVKQNGTAVAGTMTTDLGALAPQAAGTYLISNVPAGVTEVGAVVNGMTFRAHVINVVAGATTTTGVRPGF